MSLAMGAARARATLKVCASWRLRPWLPRERPDASRGQANATGCLAWLAWQDQKLDDVVALAAEAAELYQPNPNPNFHWKWAYLWPLMAVQLRRGLVGKAASAADELLARSRRGCRARWKPSWPRPAKRGSKASQLRPRGLCPVLSSSHTNLAT